MFKRPENSLQARLLREELNDKANSIVAERLRLEEEKTRMEEMNKLKQRLVAFENKIKEITNKY
jgi:predicted nuclease with TOPRIM domain